MCLESDHERGLLDGALHWARASHDGTRPFLRSILLASNIGVSALV